MFFFQDLGVAGGQGFVAVVGVSFEGLDVAVAVLVGKDKEGGCLKQQAASIKAT